MARAVQASFATPSSPGARWRRLIWRWRTSIERASASRSSSSPDAMKSRPTSKDRLAQTASPLVPQNVERLVYAVDRKYRNAVQRLLRLVGGRHQHRLEALFRRFADPLLTALHRPDFPRKSDFTKHQRFGRQRFVFHRCVDRQQYGQIDG